MEFASQESAADGQVALALVVALVKQLFPETLSGSNLANVLKTAEDLLPKGAGRLDQEALRILRSLHREFGNPK